MAQEHPDFLSTGLTKSCYILDDHFFELDVEQFRRRRGMLVGELLSDFRAFAGV